MLILILNVIDYSVRWGCSFLYVIHCLAGLPSLSSPPPSFTLQDGAYQSSFHAHHMSKPSKLPPFIFTIIWTGDNCGHSGERLSQNDEKQQVKMTTTRVYNFTA